MRAILQKFTGRNIDPNIPTGYLLRLCGEKMMCLLWGCLRLRRFGRYMVHPTAVIKCPSRLVLGKSVNIDRRCYIDALSSLSLTLGDNVSVGRNTTIQVTGSIQHIGKGITIGNNVGLGTDGYFGGAGGLEIGDDTIFGNYCSCHPENHNFSDPDTPIRLQGVNQRGIKIGSNCWIGAKATILDGTVIGNSCIVAAGAVVRGQFPDNSIIGGIPAKVLKSRIND